MNTSVTYMFFKLSLRKYAKKVITTRERSVPGCAVPKDLTALGYRATVVEVLPGDNVADVHSYAHRLLANNVPLLLCGSDIDVQAVKQSLMARLSGDGLQVVDVALHLPSHSVQDRFRFRVLRLVIMTIGPLGFRVCTVASSVIA